jgi:hypothetical protein
VFALPLLATTGSAQAAIAGGLPEHTTNRPDLVSATIIQALVPSSGNGGAVDFCFDKTLASASGSGNFFVAGYRSGNEQTDIGWSLETTLPPPAGLPPDSCVRALFNPANGELHEYTIGGLIGGTGSGSGVLFANGGSPTSDNFNYTDSTTLTGSNTHNGTAGFTVSPDLQSAIVDSTSNSIAYFFDQNVVQCSNMTCTGTNNPVAADFDFIDQGGVRCTGSAINPASSGDEVIVSFVGDTCVNGTTNVGVESVTNAVRAGAFHGAVVSQNDTGPPSQNVDNEVPTGNSGDPTGTTAKPDLTDVKIESNQTAMDFTFNKEVTPDSAADVFADLSNGDMIPALNNSLTIVAISTTSTTVRASFNNFANWDEFVVGGSVEGAGQDNACAVFISGSNPNICNTPGSQPVDAPFGNIGAFATGFTTAPDMKGAIGNTNTGVVQIALDGRAFHSTPADIGLLDQTGNLVTVAQTSAVSLPPVPAGPQVATVQFLPSQVASSKNIAFESTFNPTGQSYINDAFDAQLSNAAIGPGNNAGQCVGHYCGDDQDSVSQITQYTTTSAIAKAARHMKKQHLSKAALRRRQARLAAAAVRELRAMEANRANHRR